MAAAAAAAAASLPDPYPSLLPHDTKSPEIYGATAGCLVLVVTAVAVRLYTRLYITGRTGYEDWAALVSLLLVIGTGIALCVNTKFGLGVHAGDLTAPTSEPFLKHFFILIVIYNAALASIKATFLIQYYRLIRQIRHLEIICLALSFVIMGWSISQFFATVFSCVPVEAFWDQALRPTARCSESQTGVYLNSAGNMVTDILVFLMPLAVLRTLTLPRNQKWGLLAIFGLGFLTTIVSVIRFAYLYLGGDDPTYSSADGAALSFVEISVGLTCACLPALRPFVARYTPWLRTQSDTTSKGRTPGTNGYSSRGYQRQIDDDFPTKRTGVSTEYEDDIELGYTVSIKSASRPVDLPRPKHAVTR